MNPQVTYKPSEEVDFAIVGSGAAGGVLAKELSTAGFTVVVLEQGRWIPPHRTHDVPNLFLCDGSSFVTSGRGQPTMTIEALAFRAAAKIAAARRGEV